MSARIGIIGAGFWASSHYLPFYRDHADVEFVGVVRKSRRGTGRVQADIRPGDRDELRRHAPRRRARGRRRQLPHALHRYHAVTALEAGAHVLVEKPMAVKLADAEAIQAAAATAGRTASVAHGWNYNRLAIWAKETIDAGRIGGVTSVTGYTASSPTDLFSGRAGYGVIDVRGFPVEAEVETWAPADAGGGYLYGSFRTCSPSVSSSCGISSRAGNRSRTSMSVGISRPTGWLRPARASRRRAAT